MAAIITSESAQGASGPGLSYALGAKLCNVPLYMAEKDGRLLESALRNREFDKPNGGAFGSKFIGSFDGRSRFRVTDDGIALVAVHGILIDRGAWLGDLYGIATSYEGLTEQFQRLAKDTAIKAVVLDIDSPGGMVAGCYDLCAELDKLKKKKPVTAVAANAAYSAAYALACCADEVYITRTGGAGNIGVIQIHQSVGRMLDQMGIDTTIICEPSDKANGYPFQPLSHGAKAELSAEVSSAYQMFVAHVAKHRGMSEDAVRGLKARSFYGKDAVEAGIADGVKSSTELVEHIGKPSKETRGRRRVSKQQTHGGGRMARTDSPDDGNFESHDAAMKALAEGHTAMAAMVQAQAKAVASAAPAAPAVPPPPAAAVAAAPAAAAADKSAEKSERERISAIQNCEAAKDKPALAKHFALETDMTVAQAEAALKAAAPEKGMGAQNLYKAVAANGGNPQVAHAHADGAQRTAPQSNIERQKARFAKKG